MGVGKSTVGRLLAGRLAVAFRDTDDDVVTAEGRTVAQIFAEEGEPGFRARERQAVDAALREHGGVLALGGGAVVDPATRAQLVCQSVVYLSMGAREAVRRTGLTVDRPLLSVDPGGRWRELMEARRQLYEEVATVVVATDGRTPEEVTGTVLGALASRQRRPRRSRRR
ncbi:shikimate kinase [Streptomyces sp. NPDC006997]|uniref:shikimate kinase n=1 Tax=Streptomyces sp. NPDC006997 TaxID=3155356 RepID=UPI00340CAE50